jgi:hypothetical protein
VSAAKIAWNDDLLGDLSGFLCPSGPLLLAISFHRKDRCRLIAGFGPQSSRAHGPVKRDAIGADIQDESFGPFTFGHELATFFIDGNDFRFLCHARHIRLMPSGEVGRCGIPAACVRALASATVRDMPKRRPKTPEELKEDMRNFDRACTREFNKDGAIGREAPDAPQGSTTPASI